ncbi:hypothetical protein CONPUDRAFT_156886 [Coniophora puteana RWD-64-598 SS2]|uniref:Uncharacterized protein n=1 Tax=Coniophora puteana (strain RWD-64-598) TaxID=741705 RepID=A0A5M3MFK3_CONPW|nr:uncharacterized protein CONPUDRAFT_156886 [Coniophora puteana RWD-64-598 SS2]EIW77700.1 hypothetical protein CONPUDRAFT_156886 [Coniophora puteana RWD-64-598 SS2]
MSHIVDGINPEDNLETQNAALDPEIQNNAQRVGAAAATIGALVPPASLVIYGVTAAVMIATWLYGVYQQSKSIVRCLMASIVALVLIMETLFEIQSSIEDGFERLHPTVALKVVEDYQKSELKKKVHAEVQRFVESGMSGAFKGRDMVMNTITDLILQFHKGGDRYERWHGDVVNQVDSQGDGQVQPSGGE